MREKAKASGAIRNAALASRRYRRFSIIPPLQLRAIGWVRGLLYSVIFEIREDAEGEFYHLVTLWKATSAERKLYEEHNS